MDKKGGLVLNMLLTLLFAAIVFVPTCAFTSEFFRTGQQGHESVQELAAEIMSVGEGVKSPFVLTADENTFLTAFVTEDRVQLKETFKELIIPNPSTSSSKTIQIKSRYYFNYEEAKQKCEKPCVCLCKEFIEKSANVVKDEGSLVVKREIEYDYSCSNLNCYDLSGVSLKENWGTLREEGEARRVDLELENVGGVLNIKGGFPLNKPIS
ncbi:hypothetical protein HOC13_02930 [Candidatus Woesearchaeota archaeon]|jgi:hypothetical protein|nr:hypothetical protein [Candidatus Woesearchaeota archaeon]